MTVTHAQAQMLTSLAIACRPYRAPTWDEAGVMAAIGQIRTWQLSEVALRVIVAASDHEAKTPAVIVSPSMRVPELKPPKWEPERGPWCGECGKTRTNHLADHEFEFRDKPADPERVRQIVQALKAEIQPTTTTTDQPEGGDAA